MIINRSNAHSSVPQNCSCDTRIGCAGVNKLPKEFDVVALSVEDYVDYEGEDALRVTVTLSDDTDETKIKGKLVIRLKRAIHDRLLAIGVSQFPYVFLRKATEPDDEDDEE